MKKIIAVAASIALLGACAPKVPPPTQIQAPQQASQAQDKPPTWHKIKGPLLLGLNLAEQAAFIFAMTLNGSCPTFSKVRPPITP